jgi:cobalt-precorrin-5B (C1)-methyltransferase
MISKERHINGKKYRYGYTTGSCAAAAAKAAVNALLHGELEESIRIVTPATVDLDITVFGYEKVGGAYQCYVVKDAGDDPDVTNGIRVFAKAFRNNEQKIKVVGGIGIGRVTKKGLQVGIGEAAINPVPMQMILTGVSSLIKENEGVTVEIFIPEGVEIARRTFNERLGIVGGISVLGTSGLVIPMSEEAFKEALSLDLSVLKEKGVSEVVLTPGNYGERFIKEYLPELCENVVTTSNFIGYMLHESVRYGMKKIVLVGHIGKLVKVAGGVFHTHSSVADARCEIMASHYFLYSADAEGFRNIMNSNTTEEAIGFVRDKAFFNGLARAIKTKCEQHVHQAVQVEVLLFSLGDGLLGQTESLIVN